MQPCRTGVSGQASAGIAMRYPTLLLMLCTLGAAERAWSQEVRPEPSIASPILLGSGLGVAAAIGGFLLGIAMDPDCDGGDFCIPMTPFATAATTGTVAMVVGVHLGNRRRGDFGKDLAAAAVTYGAGIGAAYLSRNSQGVVYFVLAAIPVAQLGVTVAVERATGRENAARRMRLLIYPDASGGWRVGSQIVF